MPRFQGEHFQKNLLMLDGLSAVAAESGCTMAQAALAWVLGERPHQRDRLRDEVAVTAGDLLDFRVDRGQVTEAGVRANISIALQYLDQWLRGNGAAAINNLMEDAATAEISRSQLWQWRVTGAPIDGGDPLTEERYRAIRAEELAALGSGPAAGSGAASGRLDAAAELLDDLVLADDFPEFLTLPAYGRLVRDE
jgi:malate synthase